MKKIYARFRLSYLFLFLTFFSSYAGFAQCINQGTIADPGCGASSTQNNVGGKQNYTLTSTIGADYSVSISSGSSTACGAYSVSPSSFTANASSTSLDVLAGGGCCWDANGTSAVLTYTRIGYTNTTSNAALCIGSTRALTVTPTPLTAGTWSVIAGTGSGSITGTTFTPSSPGTVTLRFAKGGCNSDVAITINAAPTTATVGSNQTVCGLTSAGLGGNTPSVGTGAWSQVSGPGSTTFSGNSTPNATATATAYGTYVYSWTISNGLCPATSATVQVTFVQTPTTATAGAAQSVCGTLTSAALGGNTPVAGTGTWTQTGGPGVSTFSSPNSGSSTATASVIGTYTYTWTIANNPCPSSSASTTVTYYATPTTASVGGTQNICASLTSGNLGGNSPTVGTGTWSQTSGPGSTTFSNPNAPSASATASVAGTYVYTWSISNGTCTPSTASVTVNYYNSPPVALAGPAQTVCGTLTTTSLGANTPPAGFGTGTWTQVSGPGTTTFSNVNSGSSTATASVIGTYVYTWTITNGNCPSTSSNITVTYYAAPTTATVGGPQDICGASLISGPLGGNTPTVGTGAWSQTSGPGVTFFSAATSGSSTASVSVQGTYVFTWTITNGGCTSTADVTVNYYSLPTIATAGPTQNLCGTLTSNSLGGNTPATGTGTWSQLSGPGTSTFSSVNSGSSTATASVAGSYTYQWTIANGTCPPTSATINVNFIPSPTGGTVPNAAFCSAAGAVSIAAVGVSNANQYQWALPAGLSGSSTTANINVGGTFPGTYTVTVTPQNALFGVTCSGTPITGVVTILAQPVIDSVNKGAVTCFGGSDDTIRIYAHTNNGTLFYSVNGGTSYPSSTGQFAGLSAGTYNIFVKDDSLCATAYTNNPVVVTSPPDIFVSVASFGNVSCNGDSTGYVNISASGGTGALTFSWSNSATSQNISHLAAGTYTLTVRDANSCPKIISQTITEPAAFILDSLVSTNVSCYGAGDGTAAIYVSGGSPGYTYLWNNSFTTPAITNLAGGVYSVTATDNNGCRLVGSVNIINPLPVAVSLRATNVACFGTGTGSITANASGGSGVYTYTWSPAVSVTSSASNIGPGTYIVTVSDASGCSAVDSVTITQPLSALAVATVVTPVGCAGESHGAIQLLMSGGVGGYTYLWSPGAQTVSQISGLAAGTYSATITDGNGCQVFATEVLTNPTPITSTVVGTSSLCAGGGGGSAVLTVSGGVPGYTFLWSNFETTQNISNLSGGLYRVVITDTTGCQSRDSVVITQPQAITVAFATTNVNCNGAANGTITATVSGGTGTYTYAWIPNVSTTNIVTNAAPGTYVLTVTDGNGCSLTDSVVITQPAAVVSVTAIVTDITCHNGNNGSIATQVSGGTGSYTYAWTGSLATTPSISGLSAGAYTVTVTDANGCTGTAGGTITNPADITSTVTGTNITCAGAANGTATVATVAGGTAPYTYLWTTFAATQTVSGLSGGTARVIITDANGCQHRDSIILTEPQPLVLTLSSVNVTCNGAANGSVTTTVSGGTGAYTYAWTGTASTGPSATGLAPGTYSVTVTDANGCAKSATATITQPASVLTLSVSVTNITCHDANNGSVSTQVSGGSGSYSYAWTGSAALTPSISGLSAGTYTVTVTDAGGCTATGGGTITNPAAITSTTTGTNVTCAGSANGTATVTTVAGGTAPYTYLWTNFAATQTVGGLSGGLARVIITDAHGCQHRDSVLITEPLPLTGSITATNIGCSGGNTGTVTVSVSGGTGAYTYTWSPNVSTGPSATGLAAGTYHVTVADANGCRFVDSATVSQPASTLAAIATVSDMTCHNANNGSVTIFASGGTGSYTYAWTGTAATTPSISSLSAGTYTVTVTDAGGCTATASGTITNPADITSTTTSTNVTCAGSANGTATVATVAGGTAPYTYLWAGFAATQSLTGLSGGLQRVIITDAHGCQHRDSVFITEPLPVTATLGVTQITCHNQNNGALAVTATGGTGTISYLWSPGGQTTSSISSLSAGTYTVTVRDANNCSVVLSATIVNPPAIALATIVTNPKCNGANNGTVTLIINGGIQPYSYAWSGALAGAGQSATGVGPGTYYVTVTDAGGCTAVDSAIVTAPLPIYVSGIISNVTCNGNNNGSAIVTVYGGTQPYTYQWYSDSLNGQIGPITKDWTQLSGGDYYLSITDANNCDASFHAGIREPDSLKVTLTKVNVTCFGADNGTVLASVTGGTRPYHYLWNNFVVDSTQTGLAAGTYVVIVTDSNGCQLTKNISLTQPAAITLAVTGTNPACAGSATGSATAVAGGGSGAGTYSYSWSTVPVQSTATATSLAAGTYYVTVTDANGCSQVDSTTLTAPQSLVVNTAISNPTCSDGSNGFVSLDVHQGTAPYSYNWNTTPAQTGNVASNLAAGTYIATITDAGGCQLIDTALVVAPQPIVITVGLLGGASCINSADGYAVVSVTGGLAPYTYLMGTIAQDSATFAHLAPGTYSLTVTDANGCQGVTSWTIVSNSNFSVDLTVDRDVILAGETIHLTATAASDTTVVSYSWITQDSTLNFSACGSLTNCPNPTATPSASGYYTVVATNARGCTATDTVHVSVSNTEAAFMPTAFTPNGDGLNDRLEFDILGAQTLDVRVYNRWGQQVFSDPAQPNGVTNTHGWDGYYNGSLGGYDTYTYQIVVTYTDGHQRTISGTVVLMR